MPYSERRLLRDRSVVVKFDGTSEVMVANALKRMQAQMMGCRLDARDVIWAHIGFQRFSPYLSTFKLLDPLVTGGGETRDGEILLQAIARRTTGDDDNMF